MARAPCRQPPRSPRSRHCVGFLLRLLVLLFAPNSVFGQTGTKEITFESSTYPNFREALTHAAPAAQIEVRAKLDFPEHAQGRIPAVIIVHTLAGYRDENEGWQANGLRNAGFATLTYDSFATRGMGNLVTTPTRGPPPGGHP
jgi:hypothetical protein